MTIPARPLRSAVLPGYAELHCLSNFSFLRGASHPHELVERAAALGYTALALTDECSLAGVVRAYQAAQKHALHLLVGSELRLHREPASTQSRRQPRVDGAAGFCTVVALAQNRNGYGNLSELITLGRQRAAKGDYRLSTADLAAPPAKFTHLRGLPDCLLLLLPSAADPPQHTLACARWLAALAPGRAWLAIELWRRGGEAEFAASLREIARLSGLPLVAAGGALMHVRSRKALQDTVTAIRLKRPLAECGFALEPNAERHLRSRLRLASLYPSEALAESLKIAALCTFSLGDDLRYEYPEELVPSGQTPASHLRSLVYAGAAQRWPEGLEEGHRQKIEQELALIAELRYEPYFLTVHDIVAFAHRRRILCQGRGSAANSVVCYCLGVTAIDPVRMSMLVERFISRARNEPPDIDVDFEHQRREEVIQYIYEKYGRHRAALAATLITYRTRSALRDVGRALGLDTRILERLAQTHQWWDGNSDFSARLAADGLDPTAQITRQFVALTGLLRGFPRHLSQHVGGFVIARDNLARLVPIERAAMPDRSVIEWDKDDLDALGLLKVDVLSLGMLSAIRRTLDLIAQRRGLTDFTMQDIPGRDPATFRMIRAADTVGVFQIESRAQMSMLPRLRPKSYYDLVIEVAIVRPGPIQGDMVHPYLRRKQGLEAVEYEKPELKPALERTLGIPIFQEQVMRLAMIAADFSADEADELRRAMAAWRRKGTLHLYQQRLTDGMRKNGYTPEFAARICQQIEGFGDYGFPESHAASFALLAYNSAWLKRHEPAAFLVGLLNSQPMGFYSSSQLVQDAQRHGVVVLPPDVLHSDWETTLEIEPAHPGQPARRLANRSMKNTVELSNGEIRYASAAPFKLASAAVPEQESDGTDALPDLLEPLASYGAGGPAVRLGMIQIKGFSQTGAERIIAARQRARFEDIDDLARRAVLTRPDLEALAAANALVSLAGHRRQAWWEISVPRVTTHLLRDAPITEAPLRLPPASEGREIVEDYASLRLTLGRHPLALLRAQLAGMRFKTAAELNVYPNGRLARACGIVTMRQRPGTANGTIFVTLEDETGIVNVIVWPRLVERQRQALLNAALLGVYGVWQCEGEVRHLVAGHLVDQSELLGRLVTRSRDFH